MDKDNYDSLSYDRSQRGKLQRNFGDKLQNLLKAEEQILRAISTRAPLPKVLNGICIALDCQMGNMVSLISLPLDEASNLAEIASHAELFGLNVFYAADLVAPGGEELGSLQMYCCVPRSPSCDEIQLIERAACLAALAIRYYNEKDADVSHRIHGYRRARKYMPESPLCMN
ncbi:MAG: hypothetical protein PVS2B2_17350 [Candidatus Acidiferrum sp.]